MTKLFDLFPQELRDQVTVHKIKNYSSQSNKKEYAFSKIKKLPLDTVRQVHSALNHFHGVAGVSEIDRKEAFEKIIKKAEIFKICTMGFRNKYGQYL